MKIYIIGANGRQGQKLVSEALSRGHEVTAIVKGEYLNLDQKEVKVLNKDLFELTFDDLKGADVVIDAFGTFAPGTLHLHKTSLKHLTDILNGSDIRLLVVGGAASLFVDEEKTTRLLDTPEFPEEFKELATNMCEAFIELEKSSIKWTYLSPAAQFDAEGERTGSYVMGKDNLILNKNGDSYVSYADYAIAMIDEVEQGNHIQSRFTVVS